MNKLKKRAILIWLWLVFTALNAYGFSLPETLEYDLTIADIKIGNVSFEATDKGPYVQFESKGSAVSWVSLFYGLDDIAVSTLTKSREKELPVNFAFMPLSARVSINEGPNRARKEFAFDYTKKVVTYSDSLKQEKGIFTLTAVTFDALSGLYYIRHLPLKVGTPVFVNIFNNKSVYKVEVRVLRKEKLKTALGMVDTVVVQTNMDGVGDGIIYYPGDICIWLTDDDRKIPVMIEKKLKPLIEGKLPDFIKDKMPNFLKRKISEGAVRAVLVKK